MVWVLLYYNATGVVGSGHNVVENYQNRVQIVSVGHHIGINLVSIK